MIESCIVSVLSPRLLVDPPPIDNSAGHEITPALIAAWNGNITHVLIPIFCVSKMSTFQ